MAFNTRAFLTYGDVRNLLRQGAVVAILAIGETFVIITAGIDLSVGAVAGFSTVIIALLLGSNVPVPLAILITLVCGMVIGAFHGFGITKLGLPPFIMTLATLTAIPNIGFLVYFNGASPSGSRTTLSRVSLRGPFSSCRISSGWWSLLPFLLTFFFIRAGTDVTCSPSVRTRKRLASQA